MSLALLVLPRTLQDSRDPQLLGFRVLQEPLSSALDCPSLYPSGVGFLHNPHLDS